MTHKRTSLPAYFIYCDGSWDDCVAVTAALSHECSAGSVQQLAKNCFACDVVRHDANGDWSSRVVIGHIRGRSRIFRHATEGLSDPAAAVDYRLIKRANGFVVAIPDSNIALDRIPFYVDRLARERAELGCIDVVPAVFVRCHRKQILNPTTLACAPTPPLDREEAQRTIAWPDAILAFDGDDFEMRARSALHRLLNHIDAARRT